MAQQDYLWDRVGLGAWAEGVAERRSGLVVPAFPAAGAGAVTVGMTTVTGVPNP